MPTNFFWFTDDKIAGMEKPGTYDALDRDLDFLSKKGIEVIISLTLDSLQRVVAERSSFEFFHVPLADGAAPTIRQIEQFVNYINYALSGRKKILVHCGAGYGRTGTMLACYLVSLGYQAREAIAMVRKRKPQAIENETQERCVSEFESYLREKKGSA